MLSEHDFWLYLEYRVCHEFAAMTEKHLRCFWCDGFIPDQYFLDGQSPYITGRAWVCDDFKQELWEFTLLLNHPVGSRSEIEWQTLLPPEDVTSWLVVDPLRKWMHIEPSAAIANHTEPVVAPDCGGK
jgi:hypothetical protein